MSRLLEAERRLAAAQQPSWIPGGSFGFGLIAEILQHKFALHVPLYREQDVLTALGWTPSRSTLCRMAATAAPRTQRARRTTSKLLTSHAYEKHPAYAEQNSDVL